MNTRILSLLLVCFALMTSSCREDVDASVLEIYEGPINMAVNIHLIRSDSAIVRSEIRAPKQLDFANGNQEFPEGIEIKIYEKDGQLSTTMRADRGYLFKEDNIFKGEGNVQVHNVIKDQKLQSEELFWEPNKKKIYTEKFVRVQEGGTFFFGSALESDETFTNYSLKDIRESELELSDDGI